MKTFTHCIEKKANQLLNLLQGYTKGIRMTAILVLLLMGVSNAWAGITAVAVEKPSNSLDYNKVKLNIDHKGTEGDEWEQLDMTLLPITFEGKNLYIKEYTLKYSNDDLGALQFQLYKNADWVEENMPILGGGWTHRPDDRSIWNYEKDDKEAGWYNGLGFVGNSNFYFDATDWSDMSNVKLCIAHLTWHEYYELTNIPNTKLYYVKHPGGWGDAMGISVVSTTDGGGQGIISEIPNSAQKYTGFRHWGFENAGTTAYFMVNKGDRGEMPDMRYHDNYSGLNYTQTIYTAVYNESTGKYEIANSKVPINITSYKMSGNGSVTQETTNISKEHNTATFTAAHTANTTLSFSYSNMDDDYAFEGWYTGINDGDRLIDGYEYKYNPTTEQTIYARFKKAPSRTVYFRPSVEWRNINPRFTIAFQKDMQIAEEMTQLGCTEYYTYTIPGKYKYFEEIQFFRIKTTADETFDAWDEQETAEGTGYKKPSEGTNLYYMREDGGTWTTYTPPTTYEVTLIADSHGTYNVTYNGTTTTSTLNENVTITVPFNAEITVTTNTPQAGYAQTHGAAINVGTKPREAAELGEPITICGTTEIRGNFVATEPTTVYLEPNNEWKNDDAVYRAYVFHDLDNKWVETTMAALVGTEPEGQYYTAELPAGYHSLIFCRVKDNTVNSFSSDDLWNQTNDLLIPVNTADNVYEITAIGGKGEKSSGNWKSVTYSVTLNHCDYGKYGIVYNGATYYSKDQSNVTIDNIPIGTEITVLQGEPASDIYHGYVQNVTNNNNNNILQEETTISVVRDITLDDYFITNQNITAYLGVPVGLDGWGDGAPGNTTHYIWRSIYVNTQTTTQTMIEEDAGKLRYTSEGIAYYQFTIQKGCNKIQFQIKETGGYTSKNYGKSTWQLFQMPLPGSNVNCFVLDGTKSDGDYNGYWTTLPANVNDYRLLYVEQVVEKGTGEDNWKTVVKRTKAHPSDIIKANDTRTKYSLHIYNEMREDSDIKGWNNPEIILQQWDGSQWVDKEAHMVFGPLRSTADMAMMPGRRNASPDSDVDVVYDDGIENIKNDLKNIKAYQADNNKTFYIGDVDNYDEYVENFANDSCSGVWNFVVNRNGEGNITLDLTKTHRYNGDYYIRSEAATGGWSNYINTEKYNNMTRTNISKTNSNFSHYYCKWLLGNEKNVKYVIANDYGTAISDILQADETTLWGDELEDGQEMVTDGKLPADANVRFAWNEKTNFLHRAYLAGSSEDKFLVLKGGQGIYDNTNKESPITEKTFADLSNWIYYADVNMIPKSPVQVTALYKEKTQYFIGKNGDGDILLTCIEESEQKYLIRLLYDFKTNQIISGYVPGGQADGTIEAIQTNLMLIRRETENDAGATLNELVFATNYMNEEGQTAYGVLEFTPERLKNDGNYNDLKRRLYWVSFPFDVRIADVFGFGEYGTHWIIQSYDGHKRAENGLFYETTESNWINHFEPETINNNEYNTYQVEEGVLKAGMGYVVALNLWRIWKDNRINDQNVSLYFPSKDKLKNLVEKNDGKTITIPEHACEIKTPDRTIEDSHWNVIGVPSYRSTNNLDISEKVEILADVPYYYKWLGEHDSYEVYTGEETFRPLYSYMVQYAGDLTWRNVVNEGPASLAARKDANSEIERKLRLELQKNGNTLDRTFITLQEDDVTAGFDFNYDLTKIINAGSNIYSIITTGDLKTNAAGNILPLADNITIPVGVVAGEAGEYTFAMPDGTDGIVVELIDYETNTTTNLLFGDYTVELPKGTFENRFALFARPEKTATSVEDIVGEAVKGVKKYIIDGKLYLQQGELLYDAQGKRL